MQIGTSIFLIAVGAIMRYAVNTEAEGFSIDTAGLILMVVGVVGLLISLFLLSTARGRDARPVVRERDVY